MSKRRKRLLLSGLRKIIFTVYCVISVLFLYLMYRSKMIPNNYFIVIAASIFILIAICFVLLFIIKKIRALGIILSIIFSIGSSIGISYLNKTDAFMKQVASIDVKTDNMVVAVKKNDSAENLLQADNYRFGIQTVTDIENTQLMRDDIEDILRNEILVVEYESFQELGEALLQGRVNAIIYNEAYQGILEDTVEDFDTSIRILYQYGIHTELDIIQSSPDEVKEPFSIFISGIDVAGPISTNSRSDVNIIMVVNPEKKKILLVTTPRDYYVEIPEISGNQKDKLTHAGIYGVDYSMKTLEALYDTEIKYYVRVNFESVTKIVDTLGGITVNSDYAFTTRHGDYKITEGENHLSGDETLGFVRERYSFTDGDNQRGKNQQAALTAIIEKAMSPTILTGYGNILSSVGDSLQTNMSQESMAAFVQYQLDIGIDYEIESIAAIGTGDKQACFSSGNQELYVMQPNEITVSNIKEKIRGVLGR